MNATKMIAAAALFAFGVFACAAPSGEELPTGDGTQAPAAAGEENTDSKSDELRKGGLGATCAVTCSSDNGAETCCCDVGQKCVKGYSFCECRTATVPGISSSGGIFIP